MVLVALRNTMRAGPSDLPLMVLAAVAGAAAVIAGGPVALFVMAATAGLAHVSVRALVLPADRPVVWRWVMAATLARTAIASVLHLALLGRGPYGALFLDDAGYAQIAIALARHWRGEGLPPFIDPSFDHNYVKSAAILFFALGPNVLALKLVNTLLGVVAGLFVYRAMLAARLPGPRLGLWLMLVFPSLVLWSALALKDTYSLFFSLLALWGVTEFAQRRGWRWFGLTIIAVLAIENVRAFLFVILAVCWPLGVLIAAPARRWGLAAASAAAAALLLVSTSALNYLDPNIVTASVYVRQAMARGAVSGFVAPLPVIRAEACTLFVVTVPGRTAAPETPRQFDVPPGTELVVETPGTTATPGRLIVRPGDLVAVAGATPCPVAVVETPPPPASPPGPTTTTPRPSLQAVVVVPETRNVVSTPAPTTQDAFAFSRDLIAVLTHLPVGVIALLAAPFPPLARTSGEVAAAPEMLAWYALLVLAAIGLVRLDAAGRARFAYGLILLGVISLVLSLYEGNLGTLVRHRAMVIPFVIVLAATALATWRRPAAR